MSGSRAIWEYSYKILWENIEAGRRIVIFCGNTQIFWLFFVECSFNQKVIRWVIKVFKFIH